MIHETLLFVTPQTNLCSLFLTTQALQSVQATLAYTAPPQHTTMASSPVPSESSAAPAVKEAFGRYFFALEIGSDSISIPVTRNSTVKAIVKGIWSHVNPKDKARALDLEDEDVTEDLAVSPAGYAFRTRADTLSYLNPNEKAEALVARARNEANLFNGIFTLVALPEVKYVIRKRPSPEGGAASPVAAADANPAPTKKPRTKKPGKKGSKKPSKKRQREMEVDEE